MGLRIRTNTQSINAQRHLGLSNQHVTSTMEKLSSGRRINKAADDAAGLAIATSLESDIRSLAQAKRNSQDAVSSFARVNNFVKRGRIDDVPTASGTHTLALLFLSLEVLLLGGLFDQFKSLRSFLQVVLQVCCKLFLHGKHVPLFAHFLQFLFPDLRPKRFLLCQEVLQFLELSSCDRQILGRNLKLARQGPHTPLYNILAKVFNEVLQIVNPVDYLLGIVLQGLLSLINVRTSGISI
ncbi:MAG: hypothetical protein EOO38_17800 [Cytophagaceae bacterium]|nr:MAG: hypothetical protein EOO38_17800 [Cytophagaceae bacterium]